jgi:hypothetical protein
MNKLVLWYKTWQLKRKLDKYVGTLSPKQQAWAKELELRLANKTPSQVAGILKGETARLHEAQMRVTEKTERALT